MRRKSYRASDLSLAAIQHREQRSRAGWGKLGLALNDADHQRVRREQQAKALADAQATLWEADKAGGAEQLADHLVEWAQEQCNENASEDIDWDDEQTLEVLEAAIALIRRRLVAAEKAS